MIIDLVTLLLTSVLLALRLMELWRQRPLKYPEGPIPNSPTYRVSDLLGRPQARGSTKRAPVIHSDEDLYRRELEEQKTWR